MEDVYIQAALDAFKMDAYPDGKCFNDAPDYLEPDPFLYTIVWTAHDGRIHMHTHNVEGFSSEDYYTWVRKTMKDQEWQP